MFINNYKLSFFKRSFFLKEKNIYAALQTKYRHLDKLVKKKASSVLGRDLDPIKIVAKQQMRRKVQGIIDSSKHPRQNTLTGQRSRCSERSFVPTAINLYKSDFQQDPHSL